MSVFVIQYFEQFEFLGVVPSILFISYGFIHDQRYSSKTCTYRWFNLNSIENTYKSSIKNVMITWILHHVSSGLKMDRNGVPVRNISFCVRSGWLKLEFQSSGSFLFKYLYLNIEKK